jgi:hypothetical protein
VGEQREAVEPEVTPHRLQVLHQVARVEECRVRRQVGAAAAPLVEVDHHVPLGERREIRRDGAEPGARPAMHHDHRVRAAPRHFVEEPHAAGAAHEPLAAAVRGGGGRVRRAVRGRGGAGAEHDRRRRDRR